MLDSAWWGLWEAELQGGHIPEATIEAMRAQPRFHEAVAGAFRGALRLTDENTEFYRVSQDLESLVLVTLALYLDATGGLTHRRLRQVAGQKGMLSGSRISALLMRMRMIGFVEAPAQPAPGAPKIYRPSPRMTQAYKASVGVMLEAVQLMAPGPADLARCLDEPELFRAFMTRMGARILQTVSHERTGSAVARLEALAAISARRAGNVVLFSLLDAAATAAGHFPATGRVSISISALAKRGRVSRTQILKILRDAEQGGLFTRDSGDGEGEVRPALVEAVERFYAEVFTNTAHAAYGALGGSLTSR